MPRDKTKTRKKIIEAVGEILGKSGMEKLGVNSIARQARVDKVLIYRYFGNLESLLDAYFDEHEIWPSAILPASTKTAPYSSSHARELILEYFLDQLNELRRRKTAQEILRWGLVDENRLTEALGKIRQKQRTEILARLSTIKTSSSTKDYEALMSVLDAALTYLVLRSKTSEKFWGVDLHSNFGWQRIEKAITDIVTDYLK